MALEMLRDAATIRDEREPEAFHAGTRMPLFRTPGQSRVPAEIGGGVATPRTSVPGGVWRIDSLAAQLSRL